MARPRKTTKYPGALQLAILEILWQRREATVNDVHADLQQTRALAPTTVSTMLTKMERRGLVSHRTEGRTYVYQPTVEKGEVRRSMLSDVVDQAFAGSVADTVSMLLREGDFDPAELSELRAQLAEKIAEGATEAGAGGSGTPADADADEDTDGPAPRGRRRRDA